MEQPRGRGEEHPPTQPFRFTPGWPGRPEQAAGDPAHGQEGPWPPDAAPPQQPPPSFGAPSRDPAGGPVPPWPQDAPPASGEQPPGGPSGYGPNPGPEPGGTQPPPGGPWGYGPNPGPGQEATQPPPGGPWGYGPNPGQEATEPPPGGPWGYGPNPGPGREATQPPPGGPWGYGPYGGPWPPGPYGGPPPPGLQGPYGPPPPGAPWPGGPGGPQQPPGKGWRHSRRLRWGAGIAAVVLLAAGGTAAGLKLTSPPANAAQAVALNQALNTHGRGCQAPAGAQGNRARGGGTRGSSARGGGARGTGAGHRGCLRRRLRAVKGMYGEIAFHTSNGTQTLAFERGAVASVSGSKLTVHAPDGTNWTWTLASSSRIRQHGQAIPASQLASGTRVFVGGQVSGSSRDARLVFVRPDKRQGRHAQPPSGSGSSGGSTSGVGT